MTEVRDGMIHDIGRLCKATSSCTAVSGLGDSPTIYVRAGGSTYQQHN